MFAQTLIVSLKKVHEKFSVKFESSERCWTKMFTAALALMGETVSQDQLLCSKVFFYFHFFLSKVTHGLP